MDEKQAFLNDVVNREVVRAKHRFEHRRICASVLDPLASERPELKRAIRELRKFGDSVEIFAHMGDLVEVMKVLNLMVPILSCAQGEYISTEDVREHYEEVGRIIEVFEPMKLDMYQRFVQAAKEIEPESPAEAFNTFALYTETHQLAVPTREKAESYFNTYQQYQRNVNQISLAIDECDILSRDSPRCKTKLSMNELDTFLKAGKKFMAEEFDRIYSD